MRAISLLFVVTSFACTGSSQQTAPEAATTDAAETPEAAPVATAETPTEAAANPSAEADTDPTATPADVSAPPAEAKTTASGLAYRILRASENADRPSASDQVEVHYSGWTTDGTLFDSSVARGQTATFPLNAVIKGWTEGVQLMNVGSKFRFWIPAELAYGESPRPGAPKGMLVFDVELIAIK